jgi:REP element-mobilizing transposase RayT
MDRCQAGFMHKYDYRRTLPHIQKDNRPVFVTFSTYKRWVLPESVRPLVLECCLHEHGRTADLHVAVIMPDHVHLILTPLVGCDGWTCSLPDIMRMIKGRAARKINVFLRRCGPVWQDESFDHVLRSNESLAEKVDYICQNPVRAGLTSEGEEYLWLWRGKVPML